MRLTTLVTVSLLAFAVAAPSQAAEPACPGADEEIGQVSRKTLKRATRCLVNAERVSRGLPRLTLDRRLTWAAWRHAVDMVRHDYFGHHSRFRGGLFGRMARSSYTSGRRWVAGENLAWGVRGASTPRAHVAAWMRSASHRRNILNGRFREAGVSVIPGVPVRRRSGSRGATYVTIFARAR